MRQESFKSMGGQNFSISQHWSGSSIAFGSFPRTKGEKRLLLKSLLQKPPLRPRMKAKEVSVPLIMVNTFLGRREWACPRIVTKTSDQQSWLSGAGADLPQVS